ncbi:MAG: energy transducer TonB [Omnitrophica bacterium]|nr:energy transducer TonB [Candidatus Omnitrophota bacterium]
MFISRQLRLTLLISFFGHLFLMGFVSVVFLPKGFQRKQYSTVDFLGSILGGDVSFKETRRALAKLPPEIDLQRQSFFYEGPEVVLPVKKKIFNPDGFIEIDNLKESIAFAASFVAAPEGHLEREVIFRPPVPKYPEWAESRESIGNCVVFKIYISSRGLVEAATNVQGSGNPEIDASLARYIRKWRFAPVREQKAQVAQTVKISLDLK